MNKRFFIITFIIFFIGVSYNTIANPIDSLKNLIANTHNPDSLTKYYINIADNYTSGDSIFSNYIDSAYKYSTNCQNAKYKALALFRKATDFTYHSQFDTAAYFYTKAIKIFEQLNDTTNLAATWGEKGNSYCYRGIYDKCLDCFLKSLKYIEALDNPQYLGIALNNIGNVYYLIGNIPKAGEYYKKAYNIFKKANSEYGITLSTNNLGIYYADNEMLDSALFYYKISENYAKKNNDLQQLGQVLSNLAKIYREKNELSKAIKYSKEAISIFKKLNSNYSLAYSYLILAQNYYDSKKYKQASDYLDSCIFISSQNGFLEQEKSAYNYSYKIDSISGNFYEALKKYQKYQTLNDSLINQKTQEKIANLQSVYELEKQQKENQILKERQEKQEAQIQKQKILTIFIIVALILIVAILSILAIYYRSQKKYNKKLKLINEELEQQKEEIQKQNEILLEKNKEISKQKAIVQKYNRHLTESINYAKHIQESGLPDKTVFNHIFTEYFLIYFPKDIVSGDFYFYEKISETKHLTAVADCTGHGIPGAFMSILSISILKEILRESANYTSAEILEKARILIKSYLNQEHKETINDGMDIALTIYDTKNMILNYAGANRPIYFFRNNKFNFIKPDKQPIAAYIKERPFNNHFIKLQKNDIFYLFSDGYYDQLTKNSKKFLLKNFKLLLAEIYNQPLNEQKNILIEKFNKFKGDYFQTDDVTILGFKI